MPLFKSHHPKTTPAGVGAQRPQPRRQPAPGAAGTAPPESATAELGGPAGPEPTRYGDWERKGICYDF